MTSNHRPHRHRAYDRRIGFSADDSIASLEPYNNIAECHHYQRQFRSRLSANDLEHLAGLVAGHGGADPEFRVTDAARLLKLSQPSASELVQRLLERRLLRQTRTVGRSVYYRPTGAVLVAFGVSPDALKAQAESSANLQ